MIFAYRFFGRIRFPPQEEKRSYTILGLSLFSLVIFGAFAIRPSLKTALSLSKSVKDGEEVSLKLEEKIGNLSLLEKNIESVGEEKYLVFEALPVEADIASFIEAVASFSGKQGVVLSRVNTGETRVTKEKLGETSISLQFVGDFPKLVETVSWVEGLRRLKKIERVLFETIPNEPEGQPLMTLTLEMTLFHLPVDNRALTFAPLK